MKILIGQGMSVSKAALQFADQARIGGTRRSTAKRLERKYRDTGNFRKAIDMTDDDLAAIVGRAKLTVV